MPVLGDPLIGLLDERLQGRGEGSGVHQPGAAAQELTVRVREQHERQHHRKGNPLRKLSCIVLKKRGSAFHHITSEELIFSVFAVLNQFTLFPARYFPTNNSFCVFHKIVT